MSVATICAASQTGASYSVINDKTGCTTGKTSYFMIDPGSVYSIKMIASVFGSIVDRRLTTWSKQGLEFGGFSPLDRSLGVRRW
ncbi:hypothetical protein TNCV_3515881 [Trichonephila clavipes]|nr:hypothetical protein TNCV_3515881 [Trichonephila clavipes]